VGPVPQGCSLTVDPLVILATGFLLGLMTDRLLVLLAQRLTRVAAPRR
jgi:hypothetical protein